MANLRLHGCRHRSSGVLVKHWGRRTDGRTNSASWRPRALDTLVSGTGHTGQWSWQQIRLDAQRSRWSLLPSARPVSSHFLSLNMLRQRPDAGWQNVKYWASYIIHREMCRQLPRHSELCTACRRRVPLLFSTISLDMHGIILIRKGGNCDETARRRATVSSL